VGRVEAVGDSTPLPLPPTTKPVYYSLARTSVGLRKPATTANRPSKSGRNFCTNFGSFIKNKHALRVKALLIKILVKID